MQMLNVGDFVIAANATQIPTIRLHSLVPHGSRVRAPWATFLITDYSAGLFLKEEVDLDSASTAAFIFRQLASCRQIHRII